LDRGMDERNVEDKFEYNLKLFLDINVVVYK
jgi:hypothetical protein